MAVVKRALPTSPAKRVAPAAAAPVPGLTLPTELSVPSDHLADYSILLFGAKKIGKSSLAAEFDMPLFLATEPGGKALSIYQVPITDWMEMKTVLTLLKKDKRFRTIVLDTVDLAFKLCERYVCRNLGIDHPSDEDWGKGWSAVRDEFSAWIAALMNTGRGTILISHATEREIKTRSGQKYDRIQPTMTGMARDIVEGMVDIWAYYDYVGKRRVLTIRGDEHIAAGHRLQGHFLHDGSELTAIDMGTSAKEAYENLIRAFNNRYTAPSLTPAGDAVAALPTRRRKT